jgi:hypothetical protein
METLLNQYSKQRVSDEIIFLVINLMTKALCAELIKVL